MFLVSIVLSLIFILILKFLIFDCKASYITEVIVYDLFFTIVLVIINLKYISFFNVLVTFISYFIIGLIVLYILRIISKRLEGLTFILIGFIIDFAVRSFVARIIFFLIMAIYQ